MGDDGPTSVRATLASGLADGLAAPLDGAQRGPPSQRSFPAAARPSLSPVESATESARALALWRRRVPIEGTIAEAYLRTRGYSGRLPSTLGFLPPSQKHAPALIAAFGLATETDEPGVLAIPDGAIKAVQIVRLRPDGSDRDRGTAAKLTVGRGARGAPIVLAPPNDLLALAITEGIECALSAHEALGVGAWASAGSGRLAALASAVPDHIECVNLFVHPGAGGDARALAEALHARGVEVLLKRESVDG